MSNDAFGKVGKVEESAHRYGGLSRPRRSLPRGQDFSKVLRTWPGLGTAAWMLIERSSTGLLQAK